VVTISTGAVEPSPPEGGRLSTSAVKSYREKRLLRLNDATRSVTALSMAVVHRAKTDPPRSAVYQRGTGDFRMVDFLTFARVDPTRRGQ
jgi:hypothetical protein